MPDGECVGLAARPALQCRCAALCYAELASIVVPAAQGIDAAKTSALSAGVDARIVAAGIPRRLRDVGVQRDDLPHMARDAMLQTRLWSTIRRPVSEADALAIYATAFWHPARDQK